MGSRPSALGHQGGDTGHSTDTGIGRATAVSFAEEGAYVAVSGRHPDKGEALVAELKEKGAADALFIRADVRNESEISAMVDQVVDRFGRFDVAVNNAGKETLGMISYGSRYCSSRPPRVTSRAVSGTRQSNAASIQKALCSPTAFDTKPMAAGPARMPA